MKISNIIKLCRKSGNLHLYTQEFPSADQWLSDGYAIYPLYALPEFTPENLAKMYGIADKKQKEMSLKVMHQLPEHLDFSDAVKNEDMLISYGFTFTDSGKMIEPYKTQAGKPYFINTDYLSPYADMDDIDLYLRLSASGKSYIAVKQGMILYGIIFPVMMLKDSFITKLSNFAVDCKSAYDAEPVFNVDWQEAEGGDEQEKL